MKKLLGFIGTLIFGICLSCDYLAVAAVGVIGLLMILYAAGRGEEYED